MEDSVLVSGELVGADELDDLVQTIAAMKHADVEIQMQFRVISDSPALLAAVSALFAESAPVVMQKEVKKRGKYKKRASTSVGVPPSAQREGPKPEPTRGPHVRSIKVMIPGEAIEMISRFELNKRLAERTIAVGTKLHSPKYGEITVALSGDTLVVMDANERVV